jgi:hypothetical protein
MADAPHASPEEHLLQGLFGFMITKCLSAVAWHKVPDALKDGPMYYTDLAKATNTDQRALHRVMRMLSGIGYFAEVEPGKFGLTPASELIRSDHPQSLRDVAVMITAESHWQPWGRMEQILESGNSGAQLAFGVDLFTWFQKEDNVEQWEIFNAAMTSTSNGLGYLAAEVYDFSKFKHIVDIGGGHGHFLQHMLRSAPEAKGTLFDLPQVVEGANLAEFEDRIQRVGGDFFEAVPESGDCYTMKLIIHDWSDDHCRKILGNIAKVMQPGGKVIIVETVMPESAHAHPAKFMDVNMLAMTEGGCERTEKEFAALLESAGLKLVAVHPTPGPASVIEAVQA